MRKTKWIMILLISASLLFVAAGCNKDKNYEQEELDPPAVTYEPHNLRDFNLSYKETDYDFIGDVYLLSSEGEICVPSCNDSAVRFGEKGVYEIEYRYETWSQKQNVTVFTAPEMKAPQETVELGYSGAAFHIADGITAEDCFGNALQITVADSGMLYDASGLINYGEHTVTYAAVDAVGNVAKTTRTVKILPDENAPLQIGTGEITVDVADSSFSVKLDTREQDIKLVRLDGELIADYGYSENLLTVSLEVITDFHTGERELRVATEKGYVDFRIKMVDEKPPAFDTEAMQDAVYLLNETAEVPQIVQIYEHQLFAFGYKITSPTGKEVPLVSETYFTPSEEGKHTLEITAYRGDAQAAKFEINFQVYSQSDYNDHTARWSSGEKLTEEKYVYLGGNTYNNGHYDTIVDPDGNEYHSDKIWCSFLLRLAASKPYIVTGERGVEIFAGVQETEYIKFFTQSGVSLQNFPAEGCVVYLKLDEAKPFVRFSNIDIWVDYYVTDVEYSDELPTPQKQTATSWSAEDEKGSTSLTGEYVVLIGEGFYDFNTMFIGINDEKGDEYLATEAYVIFTLTLHTNTPYVVVGKAGAERKYAITAGMTAIDGIKFFDAATGQEKQTFASGDRIAIALEGYDYVRFSSTAAWTQYNVGNVVFGDIA